MYLEIINKTFSSLCLSLASAADNTSKPLCPAYWLVDSHGSPSFFLDGVVQLIGSVGSRSNDNSGSLQARSSVLRAYKLKKKNSIY